MSTLLMKHAAVQGRLLRVNSSALSARNSILVRSLSETSPQPETDLEAAPPSSKAQAYNRQKSLYKQSVSDLRKKYAEEIRIRRESQKTQEEEKRAVIERARLQRQRLKNINSAKNALRHELQRQEQVALSEEKTRRNLDVRLQQKQLANQARALALQDLEMDAKNWMSTEKEVEQMFSTPSLMDVEQRLWARPGGYLGSPNPSVHDELWRLESHTWDMSKTYPSPRDLLLEDVQEFAYQQANMPSEDPTSTSSSSSSSSKAVYWTQEKILAQNELEEKAKLRALVREEGRKALLLHQRQLMQDAYAQQVKEMGQAYGLSKDVEFPVEVPIPTLDLLENYSAMEREGAKLLEREPQRFFVFESETATGGDKETTDDGEGNSDRTKKPSYTMGKPVGLRDPIRDASPTNTPYPQMVGRLLKPDTRTEREKKRDEKQEKMWAAANASSTATGKVDVAADDDLKNVGGSSEPLDYNLIGNVGDEEDVAWEQGLLREVDNDNEKDELLQTPRDQRYSEEDVDWIIDELEKRIKGLEDILKFEEESVRRNSTQAKQAVEAKEGGGKVESSHDDDPVIQALGQQTIKTTAVDERGREYTSYTVVNDDHEQNDSPELDFDFRLEDFVDVKAIHSILETLSPEQMSALEVLSQERESASVKNMEYSMSEEEMRLVLSKVPGLSEMQIQSLIDMENSLATNAQLMSKLGIKNK